MLTKLSGQEPPLLDSIILKSVEGAEVGNPGGGWKSILVLYFFNAMFKDDFLFFPRVLSSEEPGVNCDKSQLTSTVYW